MDTKLRNIVAIDIAIVVVCLFVSLFFGTEIPNNEAARRAVIDTTFGYSVMTISVALVTFFGLLDLPGGRDAGGGFTSGRVRFCITATLLVTFVVYFGTTGYWDKKEEVGDFQRLLMPELFTLLTIIIPFYFGTTAAVEIFKNRDDKVAGLGGRDSSASDPDPNKTN